MSPEALRKLGKERGRIHFSQRLLVMEERNAIGVKVEVK